MTYIPNVGLVDMSITISSVVVLKTVVSTEIKYLDVKYIYKLLEHSYYIIASYICIQTVTIYLLIHKSHNYLFSALRDKKGQMFFPTYKFQNNRRFQ